MKKEDCFELGIISKTHGLDGEIIVSFDVDDVGAYADLESFFVEIKGQLVPYMIEYLHPHKEKIIAKLEEIDSLEDAQKVLGKNLYLPLSFLPKLQENQYYYHEIIGYTVEDENLGRLGIIESYFTETSQPLLGMKYQGKEVLIPVNDNIVKKPNHNKKTLSVNLPDGLLDVYMTEEEPEKDDD
ncbi:MAG: ribosome maturation factor RimM [Flammeovirgaceae bacterium]